MSLTDGLKTLTHPEYFFFQRERKSPIKKRLITPSCKRLKAPSTGRLREMAKIKKYSDFLGGHKHIREGVKVVVQHIDLETGIPVSKLLHATLHNVNEQLYVYLLRHSLFTPGRLKHKLSDVTA